MEEYGIARQSTGDNILRSMRPACFITKTADIHSEYVILIAFRRLLWFRERASVSRLYVHCLSCSSTKDGDMISLQNLVLYESLVLMRLRTKPDCGTVVTLFLLLFVRSVIRILFAS